MTAMLMTTLLYGVAIPIGVSAAILIIALMTSKRSATRGVPLASESPDSRIQSVLVALASAFGYAAGHFALTQWPGFPPGDATNWVLLASPLLFIPALFSNRTTRRVIVALLAAVLVGLVLRPLIARSPVKAFIIPLGAALGPGIALSEEKISARQGPLQSALALQVAAIFTCMTLMMSGSAVLGQFGAALAAALGPVWVYPLIAGRVTGISQGNMTYSRGAGAVFAVLLCGLVASGYFYASLHWGSAVLLFLTIPAAMLGARFIPAQSRQGSRLKHILIQLALAVGSAALFGIAAFALAYLTSPPLEGLE